jgi:hypothetical protein
MLYVYRQLAHTTGTTDAADLARELITWHDAMVRHTRATSAPGATTRSCAETEDCPHVEARDLWRRAQQVFGVESESLTFLAASAASRETVVG